MNTSICFATLVLVFLLILEKTSGGPACPQCAPTLHESYNERKSKINDLLAESGTGTTGSIVLTAFLASFDETTIPNANDRQVLENVIAEMEDGIIKNDSYSNDQKLRRIAFKLDQLFLNYPAIEDAIRYEQIGSWGPLCDFCYIVDEFNIPSFWEIVSTPGFTTTCLLNDLILTAAKENNNDVIQRDLFLEDCPCSKSVDMVCHVVSIDQDTPNPIDQLALKSLELPGYDMTVNQVQRVARSYYSSTSPSCRRLRDTFANYEATISSGLVRGVLNTMLNDIIKETSQKSVEFCIEYISENIYRKILSSPDYVKHFNSIFWNPPYGSLYDNIIYNDCQISVLKEHAPEYYD